MLTLAMLILMQLPTPDVWNPLPIHDVVASVEFSPIQGDDTVTSTYSIYILKENILFDFKGIDSFKVELVLESGYSITNVLEEYSEVIVESASGVFQQEAVRLDIILEGWDHWDLEVFSAKTWVKLKEGFQKQI